MVNLIVKINILNYKNDLTNIKIFTDDKIVLDKPIKINKLSIIPVDSSLETPLNIIFEELNIVMNWVKSKFHCNFKNDTIIIDCIQVIDVVEYNIMKGISFDNENDNKFVKTLNVLLDEYNSNKDKSSLIIKEFFENFTNLSQKYKKLKKKYKKQISKKTNINSNKENNNDVYIIDKLVQDFKKEKGIKNNLEKISPGIYKYSNKVLKIFYIKNKLKIRIGGGYISLENFFNLYIKNQEFIIKDEMPKKQVLRKISPLKYLNRSTF